MSLLSLIARALPAAFLVGLVAAPAAQASFVSSSANPFATGNRLTGSDACVNSGALAGVCTTHNSTTFTSSSFSFLNGNQNVVVDAVLSGDLSKGLGSYALTGVYHFTLVGRTSADEFGSFSLVEDYVNLNGTVLGQLVQLVQDPNILSQGFASIASSNCSGCDDKFLIDTGLTINGLFVIGGGDPVPVTSVLTGAAGAVPEAPVWGMMLIGFGLAGAALRRRQSVGGAGRSINPIDEAVATR
ncbi:MAG: PEP-CTERM sorting domain-containing protein [Janthinobacterium lividum]